MFYFFISLLVSLTLFINFPATPIGEDRVLNFNGYLNLEKKVEYNLTDEALSYYNGYKRTSTAGSEKRELFLNGNFHYQLKGSEQAFIPPLGRGFFLYTKVARDLRFFARDGELLWSKEYSAYPVTDHTGQLILLITADGSLIEIIDENGNLTGAERLYGNFLADYAFATQAPYSLVCFADGSIYQLNREGKILFSNTPKKRAGMTFYKSCTISSDGKWAALHYLEEGRDQITGISLEPERAAEPIFQVTLDRIYPHLLKMAAGPEGLLLSAPDRTMFFDIDGKISWQRTESQNRIYRPVYSSNSFFVYGTGQDGVILTGDGRRLAVLPVATQNSDVWRIVPGQKPDSFLIESDSGVTFFQLQSLQ